MAVPRVWEIRIPSPGYWLTSNNQLRDKIAQGRRIKPWRNAAYLATRAVRPRIPTGLDRVRVDVDYRWIGRKPVRELRNLEPTLKACVDGAIGCARGGALGYGIVADDNDQRLVYGPLTGCPLLVPTALARLNPRGGEVVLTVTEVHGC